MQKKIATATITAITILLLIAIAISAVEKSYRINAHGRVVAIGLNIYQDANLTTPLTEIDWSLIEPGETKNFTCYAQSESNVPAYLTLETDLWQPLNASDYIFLSWDYVNSTIDPLEVQQLTFSLFVDPNVSGIDHFSFNIIVTAVEVEGQ